MASKRSAPATPAQPLRDYGCRLKNPPGSDPQFFYDRWAYAYRIPIDKGAPRRIDLFKALAGRLVPNYFEWHDWTERIINAGCENKWIGLAGCAGSAKTFNVVGFAATWWLAHPEESSVILCSTTIKSLRKRAWTEVQRYYTTMAGGERFGNFVDSKTMWQNKRGDDRHAIHGIAVEEGGVEKVADNIKGIHTRRQMVVIDEATAVSGAIFDACTNLYSYPDEFIMFVIGNPRSRLDQMGRFCEPLNGWSSINIDTEEWETKQQLDGQTGIVLRFDAEKSPNIVEGRLVSKHLPTKEKVEARRNAAGSQNDPGYWSNDRGFWPPDGIQNTVLSQSELMLADAAGTHLFTGRWFMILGALDPAFGGSDRAILRFGKLGEISGGRWGLQIFPPIRLIIDATNPLPLSYQLLEQTQKKAQAVMMGDSRYTCLPENFALDDSSRSGLGDIFLREWSSKIVRIDFGGSASEDPINYEDLRPANEVYADKAAEMWFRMKQAVNHGQAKGIDADTAIELTNRLFESNGKTTKLQPKIRDLKSGMKSYKSMFGHSPDNADAATILLEVARLRGFRLAPMGETAKRVDDFDKSAEETQAALEEVKYEDEPVTEDEHYQPEEQLL